MIIFTIYTIIIFIGLFGFFLASYIYHKKTKKAPLVCPLKSNCDSVINSDYSKVLGIRLEVLGMIYYAFISINYGLLNAVPNFAFINTDLLLVFSFFAFIFSLYLISIQAFILRQWCTWCICSAFLCTLIFGLSFLSKFIGS